MAKILVTGGAGFIGTHLCRALTAEKHSVRVLDIVDPKAAVSGVEYRRGDIRDEKAVAQAIEGVDMVYHFAAIVGVSMCQEDPVHSYDVNLNGALKVAEAIRIESQRRGRPVRFAFSGSAVVYGAVGQEGKPIDEEVAIGCPLSFYGAQKLAAEHLFRLYRASYKIPGVIFRFFNVYGPGQDPSSPYSGVISIFTDAAKKGRALRLNGGGIQTRDFVSVHDVAAAAMLALKAPETACDASPINLGGGSLITVKELAEKIMKIARAEVSLTNAPPRDGDILHSFASIKRAQNALGWKPNTSLDAGLAELLK